MKEWKVKRLDEEVPGAKDKKKALPLKDTESEGPCTAPKSKAWDERKRERHSGGGRGRSGDSRSFSYDFEEDSDVGKSNAPRRRRRRRRSDGEDERRSFRGKTLREPGALWEQSRAALELLARSSQRPWMPCWRMTCWDQIRQRLTPAGASAVLAQRVQSLEEAQEGLAKREGDKGSEGLDRARKRWLFKQ